MKAYRITGKFEMGWIKDQNFVREVAAPNPEKAAEIAYSEIGSKHRARRRQVKIAKIEEIPIGDVKDPVVKRKAGAKDEE
jgi:large subunit ribosomal protein LX